ncbi:hypothetical protein V1511DRAFT_500153 [Dipodascopsis uninucleata]
MLLLQRSLVPPLRLYKLLCPSSNYISRASVRDFQSYISKNEELRTITKGNQCPSCGAPFHTNKTAEERPGYVSIELLKQANINGKGNGNSKRSTKKFMKESDTFYERFIADLDTGTKDLLGIVDKKEIQVGSYEEALIETIARTDDSREQNPVSESYKGLVCKRCNDLLHHSKLHILPSIALDSIFNELPSSKQSYTLVHVIDALDFPTSVLPLELLLHQYNKQPDKILYVINRADLLTNDKIRLRERIKTYYIGLLEKTIDIQKKSLELAAKHKSTMHHDSNLNLWNEGIGGAGVHRLRTADLIPECKLLEKQDTTEVRPTRLSPDQVHFVSARVGWGLERLIGSLSTKSYFVGYTNVGKSRLISALINRGQGTKRPAHGQIKKEGPVESFVPGMTRSALHYTVGSRTKNRTVIDLPGIEDSTNNLWYYVKPDKLKQLVVPDFLKSKNRDYTVLKSGQCLNVGGLLLVESPESNVIAWPSIGRRGQLGVYANTNIDKAKDTIAHPRDSLLIATSRECASQFTHSTKIYVDGGGVDIVVRGVGFVEIRVSGKVPENGAPIIVHVIEGVSVAARRPISDSLKDKRMKAYELTKSLSPETESMT